MIRNPNHPEIIPGSVENKVNRSEERVMKKNYDPGTIEKKWYRYWQDNNLFQPDGGSVPAFTIVIPPPNVTGILHMGHVLNNTLQDILIRYKRMQKLNTLWLPGMDHAGIATQNKVEQSMASEGVTKEDIGRDKFVEKAWEWKEKHGGIIIEQLKQLGCSCDWSRERFTLDEGLSNAVKETFLRLYDKGLIYRGTYIVNLCPRCRTAISDEEVVHQPVKGKLWTIHYPSIDGGRGIMVATTRPETMLGDTAIAVHPEDERYKHLVGKKVRLPLQDRPIPVIADEMVDREFGTGAVKITPAHDPNDFEAGNRHGLDSIVIMDTRGIMNDAAGEAYRGLDRFECREKVILDLESLGLLEKVEDYDTSVGYCYRCNSIVEPYLSRQWFVRMKPLAQPAVQAVRDGRIRFFPDRWTKVYLHWMENIRDWCISRQLWWGHRIPVWTCIACGHLQAYREEPEECPRCHAKQLEQDPDVLDTWFSSWLWPFSTLGWPRMTGDLKTYYPTQVLITAPEIIFFWVARMIMAGMEFMNDIPFDRVYLHGTVRDGIGRKMSKSLGNSPDPLDIIANLGADALRFSMVMISPRGSDIFFSEDSLNVGRTFNNKIWNAARLIEQTCPPGSGADPVKGELTLFDKWILHRLFQAESEISSHLENFRFNEAAVTVHRFIWHEFCDWYLEIAKLDLYGDDSDRKATVRKLLLLIFQCSLKMLHPFSPFITEEIWQALYPGKGSIMVSKWPEVKSYGGYRKEAERVEIVHRVITAVRTMRSETHIPPSGRIRTVLGSGDPDVREILELSRDAIRFLCRLEKLDIALNPEPPAVRATTVTQDGIDVYVDLENLVDVPMEIQRLDKEIGKIETELKKTERKLQNGNFVEKAPPEIVEKTRLIFGELVGKMEKLNAARNRLTRNGDESDGNL
ncbi:valine--tRNA ligase [bacterium]|nr:valine--tRNA ligase [candidate division CSSED10-310 bacterium]